MSDFAVDNKWGRDALSHMLNNMLAALTGRRLPHPDITSEFISEDGGRDSMQARESLPLSRPPSRRPTPTPFQLLPCTGRAWMFAG